MTAGWVGSWEGAYEDDGVADAFIIVEKHDGGGGEDTRYSHVRHPQPVLTNPRRQYERLGIFVAQSGQGCGSRKHATTKQRLRGRYQLLSKPGVMVSTTLVSTAYLSVARSPPATTPPEFAAASSSEVGLA